MRGWWPIRMTRGVRMGAISRGRHARWRPALRRRPASSVQGRYRAVTATNHPPLPLDSQRRKVDRLAAVERTAHRRQRILEAGGAVEEHRALVPADASL